MIISMPMVGGRDWDGQMRGWGGPVEVDDGNEKAVAWAKAWLGMGATLVEDVKAAPVKAAPVKAEPVKAEPVKQETPKQPVKAPAAPAAKSAQKSEQNR